MPSSAFNGAGHGLACPIWTERRNPTTSGVVPGLARKQKPPPVCHYRCRATCPRTLWSLRSPSGTADTFPAPSGRSSGRLGAYGSGRSEAAPPRPTRSVLCSASLRAQCRAGGMGFGIRPAHAPKIIRPGAGPRVPPYRMIFSACRHGRCEVHKSRHFPPLNVGKIVLHYAPRGIFPL